MFIRKKEIDGLIAENNKLREMNEDSKNLIYRLRKDNFDFRKEVETISNDADRLDNIINEKNETIDRLTHPEVQNDPCVLRTFLIRCCKESELAYIADYGRLMVAYSYDGYLKVLDEHIPVEESYGKHIVSYNFPLVKVEIDAGDKNKTHIGYATYNICRNSWNFEWGVKK